MSWGEKVPMPERAEWHVHYPTRCTCADGLTEDENWSPEFPGETRADPAWPGEGWLVCGRCDGDGWYWRREEQPDVLALLAKLARLLPGPRGREVPLTEDEARLIAEAQVASLEATS